MWEQIEKTALEQVAANNPEITIGQFYVVLKAIRTALDVNFLQVQKVVPQQPKVEPLDIRV